MKGLSGSIWASIRGAPLAVALAAYLILVLLLLPKYMSFYYKDEIAYVAAAERYAHGQFAIAPNSLWGPLISWLVAVPLSLGISSIVAARSVAIAIGAATLWAVGRLGRTLALPDGLQLVYLLTLVPYLVHYALFGASDDLPLTALLTLYFSLIFDPAYPERRFRGAVCGVLGAFSYFAKGFGLGFFIVHFTACNALHWIAQREAAARRRILRQAAAGFAIFALLAAVWVGALYQKYGIVTVGITGKYNYDMRSPDSQDRPTSFIGFVAPPPATTVSIWEDPAYLYDLPQARACCLKHWSPLDSGTALKHQLILFKLNLGRTLMVFLSYSPFTLAVAFAGLAYCFAPFWPAARRRKSPARESNWRNRIDGGLGEVREALVEKQRLLPLLMVFTILLYPIPYTFVFSDERFFWPILVLLLGLGLYLLEVFCSTYAIKRSAKAWLVGIFAASFLVYPTYKLATGQKARDATASMARQLQQAHLEATRFASNTDYGASMVVGYYIRSKYYGTPIPGTSDEDIAQDLQRKGVRYYFVWDRPADALPGMTLRRTFRADFRTLAIYEVDPQGGPA